jgi:hypothetical protein
MLDIKPWYASRSVWGGVVALLSALGGAFGFVVSPDAMTGLTEALVLLGTSAGSLFALYGRIVATKRIGK